MKRGKSGKIAAALLLTSALGIGAVELDANVSARQVLAHLLATHPDIRVAGIVAEPLAGRVSLLGVSLRSGTSRITIGTLRLPLAAPSMLSNAMASPFDDAPAAPEKAAPAPAPAPTPQATPVPVTGSNTASAENVVIVNGTTTYRLKRIDMTGTTLTSTDLAAMLDTKNPAGLEARLRKLTAAAVVIPEIQSDDATPGHERHSTLQQILLAGVANGKVSAGSASGGTFSLKDSENAIDGTIGTMEATGIDLAQIAHVFGSVRTDDTEAVLPLYDSIVINGVKFDNASKKATLSFGSIKETGVKARPLKTDLMAAAAAQTGKPASDPQSAALFDDMVHSFVIGAIELSDIESSNTTPDGVDAFGFTRASITAFGGGKLGGASLRGFHYSGGKGGKIALGTIEAGPMTIPTQHATPASSMTPPSGKVDVADIDVDIPASSGDEPSDKTGPVKFKITHLGLASEGLPNEIPTKSNITVDGLSFDLLADASSTGKPFYDMGYRHIDLSAGLVSTYDPATKDMTIDKLSFKAPYMGTLDLGLHLGNVTNGLISSNSQTAQASAIAIIVKGIDLKIVNDGLFEKAIDWKAKKDGTTVEQERAADIEFVTTGLPALVNNNPKGKLVGDAIAAFITNPKSLHIKASSANGVGVAAMGMLGTPDVLLGMIDIEAAANK